ncbi:hypothetical protein NM208_g8385 [Fusarium decemcellulare]|uniref:Uncharacterized protein n=1 Tax=Fusarium decemcellulare TaxID=57161 RepID=A0ACC1S5L6_9HYPO|nr:hypothetical protein NM208_g8385 [Fusarium decemcellulare]
MRPCFDDYEPSVKTEGDNVDLNASVSVQQDAHQRTTTTTVVDTPQRRSELQRLDDNVCKPNIATVLRSLESPGRSKYNFTIRKLDQNIRSLKYGKEISRNKSQSDAIYGYGAKFQASEERRAQKFDIFNQNLHIIGKVLCGIRFQAASTEGRRLAGY